MQNVGKTLIIGLFVVGLAGAVGYSAWNKKTTEEAKSSVGQMVMSRDAGNKMIHSVDVPHGPYLLKQVTKAGYCIIDKPRGDFHVPPNLITAWATNAKES